MKQSNLKMITYVITISNIFPTTHKRKGEPTAFYSLILRKLKKHTIRGNYDLWKKRFDKINKGEACLSVRHWNGKPYNSTQSELLRLTKEDGIGIEKLDINLSPDTEFHFAFVERYYLDLKLLANNDGLEYEDFKNWFKGYDFSNPMAIIHFTNFRYN